VQKFHPSCGKSVTAGLAGSVRDPQPPLSGLTRNDELEWKYRDAQRSTIGAQLGRLFENHAAKAPPSARVRQLDATPSAEELSP
jgi:hypothetical protein